VGRLVRATKFEPLASAVRKKSKDRRRWSVTENLLTRWNKRVVESESGDVATPYCPSFTS
jgi:hypothetical protein